MEKKKLGRNHIRCKTRTNKVLDRITYNPAKHKNKNVRELRQKLQKKVVKPQVPKEPATTLKFGSLNINGLDLEAGWAVEQLLTTKGFDVRNNIFCKIKTKYHFSMLGLSTQRDIW